VRELCSEWNGKRNRSFGVIEKTASGGNCPPETKELKIGDPMVIQSKIEKFKHWLKKPVMLRGVDRICRQCKCQPSDVIRWHRQFESFPAVKLDGIWTANRFKLRRWIRKYDPPIARYWPRQNPIKKGVNFTLERHMKWRTPELKNKRRWT